MTDRKNSVLWQKREKMPRYDRKELIRRSLDDCSAIEG